MDKGEADGVNQEQGGTHTEGPAAKRRRKLPTNLAVLNVAELRKVSASICLPLTSKDNKASIIVKIQKQESMKKKMKEFLVTPPGTPGKRRRSSEDDDKVGTPSRVVLYSLGGHLSGIKQIIQT